MPGLEEEQISAAVIVASCLRSLTLYPAELRGHAPSVRSFAVTVRTNYVALGHFSVKLGEVCGRTLGRKELGYRESLWLARTMIKVHNVIRVGFSAVGAGLRL
jgi:hypothetical protein